MPCLLEGVANEGKSSGDSAAAWRALSCSKIPFRFGSVSQSIRGVQVPSGSRIKTVEADLGERRRPRIWPHTMTLKRQTWNSLSAARGHADCAFRLGRFQEKKKGGCAVSTRYGASKAVLAVFQTPAARTAIMGVRLVQARRKGGK